jgi:hypothetical protein
VQKYTKFFGTAFTNLQKADESLDVGKSSTANEIKYF